MSVDLVDVRCMTNLGRRFGDGDRVNFHLNGLFYYFNGGSIMLGSVKLEGFSGETRIVVPPVIINENINSELLGAVYLTDIGYYPKAANHYCKRIKGSDEHILLHCVAGRGTVTIADRKFTIEANQYIVIPAGKAHFYQADVVNPWTIYWLHFSGDQTHHIAEGLYQRVSERRNLLVFDGELENMFNRFCRLLGKGYSRENLLHISLTLPYFLSGYLHSEIFNEEREEQKDVIGLSLDFLKENVGNRIGLPDIAANANFSVPHFSKIFKSRTGYAPIEYLNHLKVQKACYELQFSDKRISVISSELGFEDQYYFSRLFKDHMGVSPQTYRNSVLSDNKKIH